MKKMVILAMIAIAFTSCTTIKSSMSVSDDKTSLSTLKSSWPLTMNMASWPTTEDEISLSSKSVKQVADSTVIVKFDTVKVRIHPAEK